MKKLSVTGILFLLLSSYGFSQASFGGGVEIDLSKIAQLQVENDDKINAAFAAMGILSRSAICLPCWRDLVNRVLFLEGQIIRYLPTEQTTQATVYGSGGRAKIDEMLNSPDPEIKNLGTILQNNYSKIEPYVLTVDKDLKQVIIFKLNNF